LTLLGNVVVEVGLLLFLFAHNAGPFKVMSTICIIT
jgi:hypothetical protein